MAWFDDNRPNVGGTMLPYQEDPRGTPTGYYQPQAAPGTAVNQVMVPYWGQKPNGEPMAKTPGSAIPTVNDSGLSGSATTPGAPITSSGGSPNDREYVKQQLAALMQQHGVTPGPRGSGPADLEYYTDQAMATGGWTPDNAGYWTDRWQSDSRGGGGGAAGGGAVGGLANGITSGAFLQPYTKQFTPPTGTDDPGFQFALQQGLGGIEKSAAARGVLKTGGTQKDLLDYATGASLQNYAGAFNRALDTFNTNYGVFRNNQNDPFNKLFGVAGLGLNATQGLNQNASQYGQGLTDLTTGAANARSAGTIGSTNAWGQTAGNIADWYQNWLAGRNKSSNPGNYNDVTLERM